MASMTSDFRKILALPDREWRVWQEISLISALLMELCWISPWLLALLSPNISVSAGRIFAILAILGLSTFALMRLLALMSLRKNIRILILGILLLIFTPLASEAILYANEQITFFESVGRIFSGFQSSENLLPYEFLLVFALVITWLRAIRWATTEVFPSDIRSAFRFGFFMLVIFVFMFIWRGNQGLSGFEYGFIFFALMSMGSARIARSESHPAAEGKFFSIHWFLGLIGAFTLFVSVIGLFGWGMNVQFELVRQAVSSLWLLFWGLALLLLSPILILIAVIFEWLMGKVDPATLEIMRRILQQFQNDDEEVEEVVETVIEIGNPFLQAILDWLNSLSIAGLLEIIRPYFLWGVIALFIAIGIYFAGRKMAFWKALSDNMAQNTRSNLEDDWLRNAGKNWRRRLKDLLDSLGRFGDPSRGRKLLAAARIRRVYSFLMDLSTELGKERKKAETPLEFIDVLNKLFPFNQSDVETISNAYIRVRYGEIDESPKEVIEVDRAWLQIRLEGQRIKRKLKRQKKEKEAEPTT